MEAQLLEVTARAVKPVLEWGESGLSIADGLSNLLKVIYTVVAPKVIELQFFNVHDYFETQAKIIVRPKNNSTCQDTTGSLIIQSFEFSSPLNCTCKTVGTYW